MNKQVRYSPEVRERVVWLVYENQGDYSSQWAAMAPKMGFTSEALRTSVRQSETNRGIRGVMSSLDRD